MQEAVFGPFFLASKLNVAGSIPVTRFQKPLRMALKAIAQQVTSPRKTPPPLPNGCSSTHQICGIAEGVVDPLFGLVAELFGDSIPQILPCDF